MNQVTSTNEPAAQANQVTTGEPAAQHRFDGADHSDCDSGTTIAPVTSGEPAAEVNQVTSTSEPAAQANQVTTGEPADQRDSTAPATAIAHSDTTIAPVTSTGEPAAEHESTAPTTAMRFGTTIAPYRAASRPLSEPGHVDRRAGPQANQVTTGGRPIEHDRRRRHSDCASDTTIAPSRRPASRPLR